MKKLICILLLILTVALSACASKPAVEPELTGAPEVSAQPEVSETQEPESGGAKTEPVEPSETPQPTETPPPSAQPTEAPVAPSQDPAVVNLVLCPEGVAIPLPEESICTLDKDGAQILIAIIGSANNVRLCRADYDEDMNFLGEGETLYDAGNITEAGELGLRVFIPDVCPNVLLCYTDSEGEHVYGIFQSGEDGSLFLLDMDILFGAM